MNKVQRSVTLANHEPELTAKLRYWAVNGKRSKILGIFRCNDEKMYNFCIANCGKSVIIDHNNVLAHRFNCEYVKVAVKEVMEVLQVK